VNTRARAIVLAPVLRHASNVSRASFTPRLPATRARFSFLRHRNLRHDVRRTGASSRRGPFAREHHSCHHAGLRPTAHMHVGLHPRLRESLRPPKVASPSAHPRKTYCVITRFFGHDWRARVGTDCVVGMVFCRDEGRSNQGFGALERVQCRSRLSMQPLAPHSAAARCKSDAASASARRSAAVRASGRHVIGVAVLL